LIRQQTRSDHFSFDNFRRPHVGLDVVRSRSVQVRLKRRRVRRDRVAAPTTHWFDRRIGALMAP